jgi:seryl-tRNA synthetase
MLDIKLIREETEKVKTGLLKRMSAEKLDLEAIINLDDKRRTITLALETAQAKRNATSKTKPTPEIILEMKLLGEEIKKMESELNQVELDLKDRLAELPNIPAEDVVAGDKENNETIYTYGKKPEFKFSPKDHVELATSLGLIDYERAVKMSGTGFWCYKGIGALLEWALLSYFIDFHIKNAYEFLIPPFLYNIFRLFHHNIYLHNALLQYNHNSVFLPFHTSCQISSTYYILYMGLEFCIFFEIQLKIENKL